MDNYQTLGKLGEGKYLSVVHYRRVKLGSIPVGMKTCNDSTSKEHTA
jgi:hypothetical protein